MFNFPHTERKIYKKNFLKTVIFQITFDENLALKTKKDVLINVFKAKYPRCNDKVTKGIQISFKADQTPILQNIEDEKTGLAFEFKSLDGQRIINIDNSTLSLTVGGKSYISFSELRTDIELIQEFIALFEIRTLNKVAIRKINIIEFIVDGNASAFLSHLVSPDLLSNINYFPDNQFIKQNIQTVSYQRDEFKLNIKYGLNIPPIPDKEIGQIIIDIDLFSTSQTDASNMLDIAKGINDEVFNVFNWAISENTKNILDGNA